MKKKAERRHRIKKIVDQLPVPRVTSGSMRRRAEINRTINQEVLRETIAASCQHRHILNSLQEVDDLRATIKDRSRVDKGQQAAFMCKLGALKVKIDAQFKLLNKYLPDLRNMELGTGDEKTPLSKALRNWADALEKGTE